MADNTIQINLKVDARQDVAAVGDQTAAGRSPRARGSLQQLTQHHGHIKAVIDQRVFSALRIALTPRMPRRGLGQVHGLILFLSSMFVHSAPTPPLAVVMAA